LNDCASSAYPREDADAKQQAQHFGYGAARRALLPDVKHRTSQYLNNRAENSHRPTGRQEQRFKSSGQAQDFLSAHAIIWWLQVPLRRGHRFNGNPPGFLLSDR